jgi:hypothetical protein
VRFGFVVPHADAREFADLAALGEQHGWDGEADSTGEFMQLNPPDPGPWEAAGATWWVESWWTIEPGADGLAEVRRRIETGPPS